MSLRPIKIAENKRMELMMSYDSSKDILYRTVNSKTRYYKLSTFKTLFDEYLLVTEYGGIKNKRPTGTIKEHFKQLEDLVKKVNLIIELKINKGYDYAK